MTKIAIIGGTGLSQIEGVQIQNKQQMQTPFGDPSAAFIDGQFNQHNVLFLARHGSPHTIPPHKVNYRANIWGLKQLGVTDIIAITAVGGITAQMEPAKLAIPDQIIDYSYGREHTFFAEELEQVVHIDFTYPYTPSLRKIIIQCAASLQLDIETTATYGCTQGPRLESAAEILRMQQDKCDLVGMTGMPEASLAKELEMNYANISVVANWAAGKTEEEITMSEIEYNVAKGISDVHQLLAEVINNFPTN